MKKATHFPYQELDLAGCYIRKASEEDRLAYAGEAGWRDLPDYFICNLNDDLIHWTDSFESAQEIIEEREDTRTITVFH